jgi:hypothetical protein
VIRHQRTIGRMAGHQKPFDDFTLENVAFHQFGHIGFRADPIPGALGINHDARPIFAMIQTAGLIRSNRSFDSQPLHLFFKEGMQSLRSLIGTAPARVAFRSLIDTDKNMMGEGRHESTLYVADADKGWP